MNIIERKCYTISKYYCSMYMNNDNAIEQRNDVNELLFSLIDLTNELGKR